MLKLSVISSHNLKKKTGWDDVQLCDEAYLILRDTNRDLKKSCVHFIDLNSNKFIHKTGISQLVPSIRFSCCTPSGSKIVGILESGAVFCYDFLEKKYSCVASLPRAFDGSTAPKEEVAAFGVNNDVSCMVIVSKTLHQYCFVDGSKLGRGQVPEQCYWATSAFGKYAAECHINICFSQQEDSKPNSFSVFVSQIDQGQIALQMSHVSFGIENIDSNIRSWRIPVLDHEQQTSTPLESSAAVMSAVSLDRKCVAIIAQGLSFSPNTVLYMCNTRSEKLGVIRKEIFPSVTCASRTTLVEAMEFSSDSNFLIVLTRLGEVSIFSLFGEQLLLHCEQLSENRSKSLPAIPPASSTQLAAKQNFRVRAHGLIERRFVVTDGFQAFILEIVTAFPNLSIAYEVAQGFLDNCEFMVSKAADLTHSASKEITPVKQRRIKRQSSETALNQTENGRLLYRTCSLGATNGSIPDLVKAYEDFLGNIGSNDSILSVKSLKRRGTSLESVAENPITQCLQFLDEAVISVAQTLGYYSKFSFQNSPFDKNIFFSCIERYFETVRVHCENFEQDDKFESIYALQSHIACKFIANLAFALFHTSDDASDESFQIFWKATKIATSHLENSVFEEPDRLFTVLVVNFLISKVDHLLSCGEAAEVAEIISIKFERCLDLKNLYIILCKYFSTNGQVLNSTQYFDTKLFLTYLQSVLYQSGVNAKFLHATPNPDVLAIYILDSNLGYKTQCAKIAKEYQKRSQITESGKGCSLVSLEKSPLKLENSSLTLLYFFLSKYDLAGVLQLIDTCISCFLSYENSLWPLHNNPELLASDMVQLFPFSFVDLITNEVGQLLYLPIVFTVSSEPPSSKSSQHQMESEEARKFLLDNRSKALRSVARVMAKYFLADQKLFIHPTHCAEEVHSLLEEDDIYRSSPVERRPRKVFLSRAKMTDELNKLKLTAVWTPQLAFSLLLTCGLYEEAASFAFKLGNDRITTAIHSAAHKLTDRRPEKHPIDLGVKLEKLRQDLFDDIESRIQEDDFKLGAIETGLENYLSDLFQLGIICGIELVVVTLEECMQRALSLVSAFQLTIQEDILLPLRPLFVAQNVDQDHEETQLRNRLHIQIQLYRLCLKAANCDVLLVKHYLLVLQKNLKKTEIQLPQTLVSKVRPSADVNLLDDSAYNGVTKSFRSCLFLLWLSHVRDQFNLSLRAYSDLYSHTFSGSPAQSGKFRSPSNEEELSNRSARSFAELSQKWSDCIKWARLMIPFCRYLAQEVQLIDCLISLFMQVPLSEENVSLLASVFCQPKRVEPKPNFDEDESFVFDSSHFALSHADYDLSSNEIVPFVLEKKYRKLMIKLRNAPNFESGEVFKHFVKQQQMRRSFIIQKGFETSELFVDTSEALPEIGHLEFELSPDYISFLDAAVDVMFTANSSAFTSSGDVNRMPEGGHKTSHVTSKSTPVLLPYAKQVEKQLYSADQKLDGVNEVSSPTEKGVVAEKGKYVDDLMVPSMRHFLQQCISRKALGRQWKKHKKKQVSINQTPEVNSSGKGQRSRRHERGSNGKLEVSTSSANSLFSEERFLMDSLSNNCSIMEDHFALISVKEQISHAVLLSGDVFFSQRMDSQKSCIAWLSDWCGRSYSGLSQITEQSKQMGGSLKLKLTPNLLMNTCWNYVNSINGWPFGHSADQQVYVTLPVSAQYHVEDLKIEEGNHDHLSVENPKMTEEIDESVISARNTGGLAFETSNMSGFEDMSDSLPSITASSRMSSTHQLSTPPVSRGGLSRRGDGHSSRLSSGRISAGGGLNGIEQKILETINEPHLREEAYRKMLEAREAERSQLLGTESTSSPRRKIVLSHESLRRIVRSETSHAIQKMMNSADVSDANFQQYLISQPPSPKRSPPRRKMDTYGYEYNVQVDLSDQYRDTPDGYWPGFSPDPGYRSRYKPRHDQDERHSRSRDRRKTRHRSKRSKYFDSQFIYGSAPVAYPQRRVPLTVEIPLLQANATNNMTLLRHHEELETDPHYLQGHDYPGFLQSSQISTQGHPRPSSGRSTIQVFHNPDDNFTVDHLQNILPSNDELEIFLESRRRKLEESKNSGRLQRLAWVTGEENKENGLFEQQVHTLPPVNENLKPKLLHLETIASVSEEEVSEKPDQKTHAEPSPRVLKMNSGSDETVAMVSLKPILKDQLVGTDHEELKIKLLELADENSDSQEKSVILVTPEEQLVDLQSNLSFEVEAEDEGSLQNASTSPIPSPKKSEMEVQTVSPERDGEREALTVSQIKQGVGNASNRAATTPEIFMNLHFPHVHQNANFISVADIRESTMADLPEVTTLYHPDGLHSTSYADLHWQIVKELREGPNIQRTHESPESKDAENLKPRSPRRVAFATQDSSTSPFASPRKGSPGVQNGNLLEDQENKADEFTVQTLNAMDSNSSDHVMKAQTSDTRLEQSKVTPRTRGRTVNDQLATMAHQIEVIEDTSRRLIHEFEGTHYLMNTVEAMTNVIDPPAVQTEEQQDELSPQNIAPEDVAFKPRPIIPSDSHVTVLRSRGELENQVEECHKDDIGEKGFIFGKETSNKSGAETTEVDATLDLPDVSKPSISELDLREIFQNSLLSADVETAREVARKQEVRKWMKEKRKERMGNYIEHRRDLMQKEFQPWRQKNTVPSSTLKENIKRREDSKTMRDNEFTEKRLESAKNLLGEMVHDQAPPTSRHPHPSTFSANTVSVASTNRSRTNSMLPMPTSAAKGTSKSRSRSRSHSEDPPTGYNSWYEYYRIQASSKLAARRRIAEEIKQEREEEEAELLSRLDELSQLSERSHPDYNLNTDQNQVSCAAESKTVSRRPPKLFTSLVKVQKPEVTRSRTNSPHKSVTYQEKLKQLQSNSGPLPKPSSSPTRTAPAQTKAPGAIVASKKSETKPRVAKTYAERLKELQRDKPAQDRTPSRSPARPSKSMLRSKDTRKASPGAGGQGNVVYSQRQQKWTTRQAFPAAGNRSQRPTDAPLPADSRSRTFSMGGRGRGYQRLASQRDRPYASPYREATDTELISGEVAKKSIQGDMEPGPVALRDDVSEISDISAWSVPTKVKQLLQFDGSENQAQNNKSKNAPWSHAASESPRLTNIDFSELDEMESQLSSKLDWDAVQQIIEDNEN